LRPAPLDLLNVLPLRHPRGCTQPFHRGRGAIDRALLAKLIGATAALLLLNGRIAGISGIVGGALRPAEGDPGWRLAFMAGLVAGPILYGLAVGPVPDITIDASLSVIALGGLLVGFGTRPGGGCTSGHGVSGRARSSKRSVAATLVFMAAAAAAEFIARQVVGA